jgi:hypothetical protein
LIFDAMGTAWPDASNTEDIGPALKLASQTIISNDAAPPEVVEVNMSYATSATIVPLAALFHDQTV